MAGKILIVDDVATNRIVLKVKLASAFYETVQAASGAEALALAAKARPDLVLLDVELPDMDGIAVCEALKADPATRDIPVIMLTAKSQQVDIQRGKEVGADDYITKPFRPSTLRKKFNEVLDARHIIEEE